MPYQEVRSALLICKSIANEAVKYVHTLNIMRDCELDVPSARRFSNVEQIHILCLLRLEEKHKRSLTISPIATKSTVPFLVAFPKLSSIFVGGVIGGEMTIYTPYNCVGKKQIVLFRSLISTFVGAFRTRTLSQELSLLGVVNSYFLSSITEQCELEREEGDSPNECQWCQDACKYLPLRDYVLFRSGELCLDDETRDDILLGRKGGSNAIFMTKVNQIAELVSDSAQWHILDHSFKDDRELQEKLIGMGLHVDFNNQEEGRGDPQYISSEALREIDYLVESLQIRPHDIPRDIFYEKMSFGIDGRQWDVYCKSTVDSLISRGYPIDPNDLIIVDETKEPALQRIIREGNL